MSLYGEYLTERTNDKIVETEEGFATYRYLDEKQVYIIDIYTRPEFRKTGAASKIADLICAEAKSTGHSVLIGTCVPSTKGSTTSLKVLFAYGMSLMSASNDLIVVSKQI